MKITPCNKKDWNKTFTVNLTMKELMQITMAMGMASEEEMRGERMQWNDAPEITCEDNVDVYQTLCDALRNEGIGRE